MEPETEEGFLSGLATVGLYFAAILAGYTIQEVLMYLYSLLVLSEEHVTLAMTPEFAPIVAPLHRKLQMLGLLAIVGLPMGTIALNIAVIFLATKTYLILIPYLLYVTWILFDKAPLRGGRSSTFMRQPAIMKYFREYFPASLMAVRELDPKHKYLFGYHPHGIIALSVWANFAGDHDDYRRIMHGIDLRIVTLGGNFYVPFFRDLLLACGFIGASRTSIVSALKNGSSVMVVIGGAAESLHAMPGNTNLILKNRRGFVRLAMENGCHLVPCYGFGENELFNQSQRPLVRRVQQLMKSKLGWVLPLFSGRGVFSYNFGILPHRVPLTSVIGEPIPVPHVANPTNEQIEHYHKLYIKGLKNLYKQFKYLTDGDDVLQIID